MAIFVVIPQSNPNTPKLAGAIASHFGDEAYELGDGLGWLIASKKAAQEISNILGVSDGTNGAALV